MPARKSDPLKELLTIRILIAFLGEKDQFGWWRTRFLGAIGDRFLAFTFPRSVFAAGVTAASEAGKAFHDQRIGKGGVFHLFRLPQTLERRIHDALLSSETQSLRAVIARKDTALDTLAGFSRKGMRATEGPVCVGDSKLLLSGDAIPTLATLYEDAFNRSTRTLPYFTVAKE